MPAPTTDADLIDLVQKSGVVEPTRLTAYLQQLRDESALPADPSELAEQMVRDGILTTFQAEQFRLGKWKRFAIGKYRVLERLGAGGMGQVFLCEHKLMRRLVAVKVLPTARAEEQDSLERFYREARAVAALDHPNLVRAFDIDQDEALHFLVLEFVDGANLQDIVRKSGPLDPTRACHYVYQASLGLQYAFEVAGVVHRDIKPSNILVDRTGLVKILDMGLARFFHDEQDMLTRNSEESVLGTADYLAPEQATDSHKVDIRGDIYSLGATFYFLLTGQPPFPDGSVAQKLIWHQTRQPKPVRLLRPGIPEAVAAIQERMMAKDAGARYQTPADLALALASFVQTPILPPTDAELPQPCPAVAALGGPAATSSSSRIGGVLPQPAGLGLAGSTVVLRASTTPTAAVALMAPAPPISPTRGKPATSNPQPVSEPMRPASVAAGAQPARAKENNPFAGLVGSGDHSPFLATARQVYATASSRASSLSLPKRILSADLPRNIWLMWIAAVVAVCGSSAYAYWYFFSKP